MSANHPEKKTKIGFIGLGQMGLPMASNLIKAGYSLKVHTRSRSAEKDPLLKGSISGLSPYDVARSNKILILCVSDDIAVENILFGIDGAIKGLRGGSTVIDCSTISPVNAQTIGGKLKSLNINYLDAPVTGGTEGAIRGSLSILIGGNKQIVDELMPIFKVIGSNVHHFGGIGSGQKVKAVNQVLVAGCYAAVAEAIALGENQKLPMDLVIKALQNGAGGSWALTNRSEAMLKDSYPLGFKLALHYKDLKIALDTAQRLNIYLPVTTRVKELEEQLIKEGYSNQDISILRKYIR